MNANEELRFAYAEWRRLAEAEGEAIRHGNWDQVEHCQNSIQQLQPQISRCTDEARNAWMGAGVDSAAEEKSFRNLISELIEIERCNSVLLNEARQAARAQFGDLEQAGHTLRQVQRSYAPIQAPAWTSFS